MLLRNSVIVFGGEHQIAPRELPQHIVALPGQPRHLLPRHDEHTLAGVVAVVIKVDFAIDKRRICIR